MNPATHTPAKTPAFEMWRQQDFNGNLRIVRTLPAHRRHLYPLLHNTFLFATAPYAPDDDQELWLLADADSLESWRECREAVLADWIRSEDTDGRPMLTHPLILASWGGMVTKAATRSEAAKGKSPGKAAPAAKDESGGASPASTPAESSEDSCDEATFYFRLITGLGSSGTLISDENLDIPTHQIEEVRALLAQEQGGGADWFLVLEWLFLSDAAQAFYRDLQFANCRSPNAKLTSLLKTSDRIEHDYLKDKVWAAAPRHLDWECAVPGEVLTWVYGFGPGAGEAEADVELDEANVGDEEADADDLDEADLDDTPSYAPNCRSALRANYRQVSEVFRVRCIGRENGS